MSAVRSIADVHHAGRWVRFVPILLQKTAARDWTVGLLVKSRGFDTLALTLFTQLQRYAMHRA
jgi:hypothetical protein